MGLIRALMSVVVPDTGVGGRGQGCSNQEMACSKGQKKKKQKKCCNVIVQPGMREYLVESLRQKPGP